MSVIASINFKKSNVIQTRHNDRTLAPSYLISDSGCKCNRSHEIAIKLKKQIIENAKEAYKTSCKARNKKFQATSYEWSAVCNIKSNTTMQDLENLAKHFEDKYGFQCYQIAIHRDEGHIDDNGNKAINHHAHLEFITLDKATGKNCFKLRDFPKSKMREIQDEVAEILKMERGQDKRISKRERIEPRKYAQMKEAERKKTKKLKQELETKNKQLKEKWLTNKQIDDFIKATRKSMIEENKELEEANQELIYNAKDYKDLRSLGEKLKGQNITIEQLERQIEELLQLAKEKAKKELKAELEAKDQEIEALKAENNEIKAQKLTLTQDQIQEIINQALAQKEAEIEKKNQEISKLKAEKEQFQELLEKISENQTYNENTTNDLLKAIGFKDDVSELQAKNTNKTENQEEDQEQDQTHNENDDLGIHKIIKKTTIKK